MSQSELITQLSQIVGSKYVLTDESKTEYYRRGFRSGIGSAIAVVFPQSLVELWKTIEALVDSNCIIILQAAKTGLTEGSAPKGNDYDRDVVVVSTLAINSIHLINDGKQAISLSGATLHRLETELEAVGRTPHSVIGSSQIGSTVVGGIANNSGGALVKRGPAYTEMALFAQVDAEGKLHFVNHLGIDGLGDTPEEILANVEAGNFDPEKIRYDVGMASDNEYIEHVRDVTSDIPARFNADSRRLYEASGCAGKLAVFAVRTDTFAAPDREQVFYIGTNNSHKLAKLRSDILTDFENLPEMGEYMHKTIFEITEEYGKDTFLAIEHLGTQRMPQMFATKAKVEALLKKIPGLSDTIPDRVMQGMSRIFPQHLPKKMLKMREKYDHHLLLSMSDKGIEEARTYLEKHWNDEESGYFECTKEEGDKAFLHRFAAAGAAARYQMLHPKEIEPVMALDIALRRNDMDWVEDLPNEISDNILHKLHYGHFMCNVFHQNYLFKKGTDIKLMKKLMLEYLDSKGAKYPAEHNVGHLYKAENPLQAFYKELDPTNTFNPGVGQMSKYKGHCSCCGH